MYSVKQACDLCVAIYTDPVTPDVFDHVFTGDQCIVGVSKTDDGTAVTFRATLTAFDWILDAIVIPYKHPQLGTVHEGFYEGMDAALLEVSPLLTGNIYTQGHSLGGPRASYFAGLCAVAGKRIKQLTMFEPPKPGFSDFKAIVQKNCDRIIGFQNGCDPVPDLPLTLPREPWVHIVDLIKINVPPKAMIDRIVPSQWHALELCQSVAGNY